MSGQDELVAAQARVDEANARLDDVEARIAGWVEANGSTLALFARSTLAECASLRREHREASVELSRADADFARVLKASRS